MFKRILDLPALARERSCFLLGPRQTGKSTLLRDAFPDALYFDLLDARTYRALAVSPELVGDRARLLKGKHRVVVIDEIQKLPELLDEVHRLIELDRSLRFVLTGSSARRLRERGRNLLGGRAGLVRMHPLAHPESARVGTPLDWKDALIWGGLPSVRGTRQPKEALQAYVGLYLQEEVRAEGWARSIPDFSRFLEVAATMNGEIVNYTKVGNDAQLSPRTVRDHFQVLQDTLIGDLIAPFQRTPSRKAVATEKFYLFDLGVTSALLERWALPARSPEFGRALEHLIQRELRTSIDYLRNERRLYFWRSNSQFEVDFVLTEAQKPTVAIEVKASRAVSAQDLKGLNAFAEDWPEVRKIVVSQEPEPRITQSGAEILPVALFLQMLWDGEI